MYNQHKQPVLSKKIVILVDELEVVSSTNEKKLIQLLLKINNEKLYCPIVFISHEKHNKFVNNIIASSMLIKFKVPSEQELETIVFKIFTDNKMKLSKEAFPFIIKHSQNDIRRLILTIQDLYHAYGTTVINANKISKYLLISSKKETDPSLYEAADALLYKYDGIENSLRYYNAEKVLLPLMVHFNYIRYIMDLYPNKDDQYRVALNVSDSLSKGDIIENYIYNDQQWDLQNLHGVYSCVEPSFYLNYNNYGKKNSQYMKHYYRSIFSTDLHKTSAKKQNKKKMIRLNKSMGNVNITDCIFLNKLLKKYLDSQDIEGFVNLLGKDYNIKYEHIDALYKIDKLFSNKKALDTKIQNKIKILTGEGKNKTRSKKKPQSQALPKVPKVKALPRPKKTTKSTK
jgi:replication factor C subunit 1